MTKKSTFIQPFTHEKYEKTEDVRHVQKSFANEIPISDLRPEMGTRFPK